MITLDAPQVTAEMLVSCCEAFCDSHFTCDEAEALYATYRAFGLNDLAERFIDSHSRDDVDPEDDHYTPPPPENLPRKG